MRRRQLLWAAGALAGCAQPAQAPVAVSSGAAGAPVAPGAHVLATEMCGGRVGALYHSSNAREFNAPDLMLTLDGMIQVFDRCGLDPRYDIDRAFGTGPDTFSDFGITVLQHAHSPSRVASILEDVGGRPAGLSFPARRATISHVDRILCAPAPDLLVFAPAQHGEALGEFARSGGLPEAPRGEVAFWFSEQPHVTVDGSFFPETILRAEITTRLDGAGSAKVRFSGHSSDEAQALRDAAAMQSKAREATTVDIGVFKLELFGEVTFRVEGRDVICEKELSADEVSWVVAVMVRGIPL
jgi:hypothetical protein